MARSPTLPAIWLRQKRCVTNEQPAPTLNRKAHPAAARGHRIRIVYPERLAHQIVDEIEFGSLQHFERDGIDQQGRAIAGHRNVVLGPAAFDVERILEARAAPAFDRDTQGRAGLALENLIQSLRRAGAERDALEGGRDSLFHDSGP